jgi:surface polysaccharide O-acyltransferase-like enzyme
MLYSFASFGLLFKVGLTYKPILLSKLYQNSFGIYLVHVAVFKLIPAGWHALLPVGIDLPVTIIITLAISYGVVEVVARTPLLTRLLLGRQRSAGRDSAMRGGNQMKNVTEGGER